MKRTVVALLALTLALSASSCGKPGPGNVLDLSDGGLPMEMLLEAGSAWESSPWMGTDVHWLPYGPHEQLRVHHTLGRTPVGVITYISFTENGFDPSQAAGDLARLVEVDDQNVTVWNDTNGSYFARIVVF